MRTPSWLVVLVACGGPPTEATAPPSPTDPVCADSAVTWDSFARPLLTTWCTPCHGSEVPEAERQGAPLGLDYDTWPAVRDAAPLIRRAVAGPDATMPPQGGLTDDERDLLATWIDCGMPGGHTEPPDPCEIRTVHQGTVRASEALDVCATANHVGGDLVIDGDPSALGCLCGVDGDLVVDGLTGVTEASLPALEAVGGRLSVVSTRDLVLLDLSALTSVGGELRVEGAADLAELRIATLTDVSGSMVVRDAPALTSLDPARLQSVGGDLILDDLPALSALRNTGTLHTVGGSILLRGLGEVAALDGFDRLGALGGDLQVLDNPALVESFGFHVLTEVPSGSVRFAGNGALRSLGALPDLEHVGGDLEVLDHPQLAVIETFPLLASVAGELRLAGGPSLVELNDLASLDHAGAVHLEGLGLAGLDRHFPALRQVDGDLVVAGNPSMDGIIDFPVLETVGGLIELRDDPELHTVLAFAALTTAPPVLRLDHVPVQVLAPLSWTTAGTIEVRETGLTTLDAWPSLTSLTGGLVVEGNLLLDDISGLASLDSIGGDLVFVDNPQLSSADIATFTAGCAVTGTTTVTGNGP